MWRLLAALSVALGGCGRLGFAPEIGAGDARVGDADVSGFAFRKQIKISDTITETPLANFPLLVTTTDPDLASARDDAADLAFVDANGGTLAFELETWDRASGQLVAWVRIPLIAPSGTTIYLYYGDATKSVSLADAAATWSEYRGVWHVNETPIPTAQIRDSSPAGSHGTVSAGGGSNPAGVAGVIGGAIQLDGADDHIKAISGPSIGGFVFSMSVWAFNDAGATGNDYALDFATDTAVNPPKVSLVVTDGKGRLTSRNDALDLQEFVGSADLRGAWHHLAGTGDGSRGRLYIDGVLAGEYSLPSTPVTTTHLAIGQHTRQISCCWFAGALDEPRFAEVTHSADWIAAEFRNQSAPNTYVVVGAEQATARDASIASGNELVASSATATAEPETASVEVGSGTVERGRVTN